MVASPKRTDPLDGVVKPVTTSRIVVLPAPFGPMSPTTSPGSIAKLTPSTATTPPNFTTRSLTASVTARRRSRGGAAGASAPARGNRSPSTTRRSGADRSSACWSPREYSAAMPSGDCRSTRIAPRPDSTASHVTMSVPDGTIFWKTTLPSAVGAPVALTMPDDPRDAADDRVLDQQHRAEHVVLRELHVRLAHREQHAAERRDRRRDRERVHLRRDDVDAERGRGALVAADREEARAGAAAPQVRDEHGDEHEHDEDERAVALRVPERIEVDARERHALDRQTDHAAGDGAVREDERVEHQRDRERGDGEARSARPDRGQRDDHADDRGPDHRGDERDLERPPVGRHEPRGHPRAEPRQRELAQRELARVAGDDDDRAQDDRDRKRRDERVGPRVDTDEQRNRHDDPDHDRDERHPAVAGQGQARERLAPLQARPAGRDQEHEDDGERDRLPRAR